VSVAELMAFNGLEDPSRLVAGGRVLISSTVTTEQGLTWD